MINVDMNGKWRIEPEVADIGVSAPLKTFRIPFRKKPVLLRVTVKRPTTGSKMRIDRLYLSMGVTLAEYRGYTVEERMRFLTETCLLNPMNVSHEGKRS